jgi:hypothetical protein
MAEQSIVAAPGPEPERRFKKRITIPAALLTLLIAWLVIRGTWADTTPRNPSSSAEGAVTQLFQGPQGPQIRSALVIDYPIGEVWAVVTDYDRFAEIFPHVCHTTISRDGDGRYHLSGSAAESWFGEWPFDVHIAHHETPQKCTAEWDDPYQDLRVNRGSWTLTPLGADRTLAVYTLEAEVGSFPNFIVRNALLLRVDGVPAAVAREVAKRHRKPA